MTRTPRELMLAGELYQADDPELAEMAERARVWMARYAAGSASLADGLGSVGEDVVVRAPVYVDYGVHITIGAGTFVNYGATLLDCAPITIGASCQIATGVQLVTPTHPVEPVKRRALWECAHPITLGDNVWLGAGAIVCPGVTIGDDTVVGAGAVVVKDLPAGVVAVGNPARVIRSVSD